MSDQSFEECKIISIPQSVHDINKIIMDNITGAASIRKANPDEDRSGTDYFLTLRGGSVVNIDLKARRKGCSKYWKNGPDIVLEIWSVAPTTNKSGTLGWTLSESATTHYTLHIFDKEDTDKAFLFPFQLLRIAFLKNGKEWCETYGRRRQRSFGQYGAWESESVFVPAHVVIKAVSDRMSTDTL